MHTQWTKSFCDKAPKSCTYQRHMRGCYISGQKSSKYADPKEMYMSDDFDSLNCYRTRSGWVIDRFGNSSKISYDEYITQKTEGTIATCCFVGKFHSSCSIKMYHKGNLMTTSLHTLLNVAFYDWTRIYLSPGEFTSSQYITSYIHQYLGYANMSNTWNCCTQLLKS